MASDWARCCLPVSAYDARKVMQSAYDAIFDNPYSRYAACGYADFADGVLNDYVYERCVLPLRIKRRE